MIYHKDIGYPDTLVIPEGLVSLQYTSHAMERKEDKYEGLKVLPTIVRILKSNVFEIHTENNINCTKVLVRTPYDYKRDITLVLELLPMEKAKVITFWLNLKKDQHKNFDKTRYSIPENKQINE